jgi:hypothetical protein
MKTRNGYVRRDGTGKSRDRKTGLVRRAALETLETRRLFALLGIVPGYPQISTDAIGTVTYTYDEGTATGTFDLSSNPFVYQTGPSPSDQVSVFGPSSFKIKFETDDAGNVVGGILGADFIVTGSIDLDNDEVIEPGEPTGDLLIGEIKEFGFDDSADSNVDFYDFRLSVEGGEIAGSFAGGDIGITMSSENSSFAGNFLIDFTGLVKATVGPIPGDEPAPASIGNYVWHDENANGIQDTGELGIDGATVELYSGNSNIPLAGTFTIGGGFYLFDGLSPGDYHVKVTPPAGYYFTTQDVGINDAIDSDSDTATGVMATTNLVAGETDLTWDAGLVTTGIDIEKFVNIVTPICSGGEGLTPGYWKQPHHFDDWTGFTPNQSYNAVFGVNDPDGASLTLLDALSRGGGGYKALGRHAVAALLNAAHANISFAYSVPQVISWVQFAYATGDFLVTKDRLAAENELEADITGGGKGCTPDDTSGVGEDADNPPGVMANAGSEVKFTIVVSNTGDTPLGNVDVVDDNGTPGNASDDFSPAPILIGGFNVGDNNQNGLLDLEEEWLYAYTTPVSPGPHCNIASVTAQPVLANANVGGLVDDSDAACYTSGSASIGNFVWLDANANGIQDGGEIGLSGVTVELYNSADVLIGTQATGVGGLYLFSGLVAGNYYVKVTPLAGYSFSPQNQGVNDSVDSDANTTTGAMAVISLAAGETDLTWDAGLFQKASIGNYVWRDLDADGIQDASEVGAAGVTVRLLDSGGTVIATTATDGSGLYGFTNLMPGTYSVEFVKPAGFNFTLANAGANDAVDSDANTSTGKTGTYVLASGQSNLTVDAGLVGNLHGLTGTIGFWANNNGQTLIKLFNATSLSKAGTSTALGNWLAAQFPKVYGVKNTPNYFAGKTTAYIANRYIQIFNGASPKTDAQFLALCFAIYTTTKELNSVTAVGLGQDFAMKHGFILSNQSSSANLRNRTWNVGDYGEAVGTIVNKKLVSADNQSLTVWTILQRTNSFAVSGVLWAKSQIVGTSTYAATTLQKQGNLIFSALNEAGDILPWM